MKKLTINFTAEEMALLNEAQKLSGIRTKTEFLRHLVMKYIKSQ